jgi:hypothetical protein
MSDAQTSTARGMTRAEAAKYCRLSRDGYDVWVKRGLVPPPIPGTNRYDRKALDRALDKLSGLAPDSPESKLDQWLKEQQKRAR